MVYAGGFDTTILCADTDADIARYSSLSENDHLFQAKYQLYMPTKEQLKLEIEREKEIYRLQHSEHAALPDEATDVTAITEGKE